MSSAKDKAPPPKPSEPIKLPEPPSPDVITGSGNLEKRASVIPGPQAQMTPMDQLVSGPSPGTDAPAGGSEAPAAPAAPAAQAPAAPPAAEAAPTASSSE
jgi:translation initiation factor IF-2